MHPDSRVHRSPGLRVKYSTLKSCHFPSLFVGRFTYGFLSKKYGLWAAIATTTLTKLFFHETRTFNRPDSISINRPDFIYKKKEEEEKGKREEKNRGAVVTALITHPQTSNDTTSKFSTMNSRQSFFNSSYPAVLSKEDLPRWNIQRGLGLQRGE